MKILESEGVVIGDGVIACLKNTPFFISESKFGVKDFLLAPRHLSCLKESIIMNKILGLFILHIQIHVFQYQQTLHQQYAKELHYFFHRNQLTVVCKLGNYQDHHSSLTLKNIDRHDQA